MSEQNPLLYTLNFRHVCNLRVTIPVQDQKERHVFIVTRQDPVISE